MKKNFVWIFPFALYRLDKFEDYLTKMYYTGYQLKKLYLGFILVFEPVTPKAHRKCIVLTRYFHRNMRREKWNDADFLKSINPKFNKGNGFLFDVYSWLPSVKYEIRLTGVPKDEDIIALREHRRKRILRVNLIKLAELILVVAGVWIFAIGL